MQRQKESRLAELAGLSVGIVLTGMMSIDYAWQRLKKVVYSGLGVKHWDGTDESGMVYQCRRM